MRTTLDLNAGWIFTKEDDFKWQINPISLLEQAKNFKVAKLVAKLGSAFPNAKAIKMTDELGKIAKPEEE